MEYRRAFIENSYIFITVVTSKRRKILIKNIKLLRKAFENAKRFHSFEIYAAVILDDHFHIIIKPEKTNNYPMIIRLIKNYFSRNIDISSIDDYEISPSRKSKKEKDIWQRRYWEHTIQDEKDLYNHLDYIHYNPVKHCYVDNVKNWEYSSFHKFVKDNLYDINWGCFEDVKKIQSMNYE
ncbi:MAG: hypothetical protein A2287_07470 [Candidatus Melainabacteria bacterium RIFOXYA12_FULL_32_12]|nr:MAG: hypothetical protein A2287_07470 [Candidatus Melainabacteria bacterium RIFOXYA12_FULL_32_12]